MKEVEKKWCPTKDMVADFMTKPLQGSHSRRLRDLIMGMTSIKRSKNLTSSSVKLKKRNKKAERLVSPSCVNELAQ
jgi:hypothetical protein